MRLRNRLERVGMNLLGLAALVHVDPVGSQRLVATDRRIGIEQRPADLRILIGGVLEIAQQEPVMVAHDAGPGLALGLPLHEEVDHAPAVRATINEISEKHDGRAGSLVLEGQFQRLDKLVDLAVNVANGVAADHLFCLVAFVPGRGPGPA